MANDIPNIAWSLRDKLRRYVRKYRRMFDDDQLDDAVSAALVSVCEQKEEILALGIGGKALIDEVFRRARNAAAGEGNKQARFIIRHASLDAPMVKEDPESDGMGAMASYTSSDIEDFETAFDIARLREIGSRLHGEDKEIFDGMLRGESPKTLCLKMGRRWQAVAERMALIAAKIKKEMVVR